MTNDSFPRGLSSRLADKMAQLLEREEREAVVGDYSKPTMAPDERCLAFWA